MTGVACKHVRVAIPTQTGFLLLQKFLRCRRRAKRDYLCTSKNRAAFLAFLQTMAGASAPNVDIGDETQIPENKTPEQFTENVFALAMEVLSKKGKIDPTVFTFGRGKVRMFRIRDLKDHNDFSTIVSEIVRNTAPDASRRSPRRCSARSNGLFLKERRAT